MFLIFYIVLFVLYNRFGCSNHINGDRKRFIFVLFIFCFLKKLIKNLFFKTNRCADTPTPIMAWVTKPVPALDTYKLWVGEDEKNPDTKVKKIILMLFC